MQYLKNETVAIIGAGNLGMSIAAGLISEAGFSPDRLWLSRTKLDSLEALGKKGVHTTTDNRLACQSASVIILAVKPYMVASVMDALRPYWREGQILISVVSGVSIRQLKDYVPDSVTICRAMPNTAIAIGESLTCIAFENEIPGREQPLVLEIFKNLGATIIIHEDLMNAATVLGACGIAYALRFIRAMVQGGIEIGFDAKSAAYIANQTVRGAATLLQLCNTHPEAEIDKVTTPRGCTIAGLNEMEHQGFSSSLIKGITISYEKIR